jgi:hypothetical protein
MCVSQFISVMLKYGDSQSSEEVYCRALLLKISIHLNQMQCTKLYSIRMPHAVLHVIIQSNHLVLPDTNIVHLLLSELKTARVSLLACAVIASRTANRTANMACVCIFFLTGRCSYNM